MSTPSSPKKQFDAPFAEPKPTLASLKGESTCGFPCLPASPIHANLAQTPEQPMKRLRRRAFLDAENKIRVILQGVSDNDSEVSTPTPTCIPRRRYPKDCPHPRAYMKENENPVEVPKPVLEEPTNSCLHIFVGATLLFVTFSQVANWYFGCSDCR